MARARKIQALLLTISVMVTIVASAVPAHAAPQGNVNLIDTRQVLAGEVDKQYTFAVNNTGNALLGTAINHIVIVPPGGFTTDFGVSGPAGWTFTRSSNGQIVFKDGSIAPGSNGQFKIQADAARPPHDLARTWKLFASDDGGRTLTQLAAGGATGATMDTTIRTLQVTSTLVTGPAGVTDKTATEGQGGIGVQTIIRNMGSAAQVVTPSLSGRAITIETQPGARSIASSGTETFQFVVRIGNKADYTCNGCGNGNVTFTGGGRADNTAVPTDDSVAISSSADPIQVMSRLVGTFTGGSLAPTSVAANRAYEFALSIDKDGDVAAANLTGTSFSFSGGEFTASLTSPATIAGGDNQATRLTFASTTIPTGIEDGDYTDGTLVLTGTDENGVSFNQQINVSDVLNVDSSIPDVIATMTGPASRTSAPPAVKNGSNVNLRAEVTDGGEPCGSCTIQDAYLQQYAGGTAIDRIPVNLSESTNPLEDAGVYTATFNGNYAAAATSIEFVVVAADVAQNVANNKSSALEVDNIAPALVTAATGAGAKNRILVQLSEIVGAPIMNAGDWNVQGYTVQSAQLQPDNQSVLLTTTGNVADNATPTVQYEPNEASRGFDRVDNKLADQALNAVDGIVPVAPLLAAVVGGEQNNATDAFHTNDSTPGVTYGSDQQPVGAGHRVQVFEDVNKNGQLDANEPPIGQAEATGNTVTIELANLGTQAREVDLLAIALDANNNASPFSSGTLQLDFTEPAVVGVANAAGAVTVTFNEALSGNRSRDFATDWTLHDRSIADPNFWSQYKPASVGGGGAGTQTLSRQLQAATADVAVPFTHVDYEYQGPAGARYVDLAGNELLNGMWSIGPTTP